ncbi:6-O-methylguanine DNA methyltransferase [Diplocarpon rosae]|nr:6-O-methylguanine DNA methyltransferase [Diplocarpon rosae]
MPRTDEAEAFFDAVYTAVQEIPYGKVTSYGHIARLIGTPSSISAQRPRQVGMCLKHLSPDPTHTFHNNNVPWQRVINSKGVISPRAHPSGAASQARALRSEGVTVSTGSFGELSVDLGEHGWFPRQLPSEVAAGITLVHDSESEDGDDA